MAGNPSAAAAAQSAPVKSVLRARYPPRLAVSGAPIRGMGRTERRPGGRASRTLKFSYLDLRLSPRKVRLGRHNNVACLDELPGE